MDIGVIPPQTGFFLQKKEPKYVQNVPMPLNVTVNSRIQVIPTERGKRMAASEVRKELDEIEALAKKFKNRLFHPLFFAQMNKKFQGKFDKVADILTDHGVLKYEFQPSGRIVWIVRGKRRDYLILPDAPYCHCTNFYMHILSGKGRVCGHLTAQRISVALNIYQSIMERDELFPSLTEEWNEVEHCA